MTQELDRRAFLLRAGTGLSAAWLSANWTAVLAAGTHARSAAESPTPPKLEFLTLDESAEIDAIAARIIPTDDKPGAREAGVVYFVDRSLVTFAADNQKTFREGLPEFQARVSEMFPGVSKFSSLSPEQQDHVLHYFDDQNAPSQPNFPSQPQAQSFFEAVRWSAIAAFLVDPDFGGNHDGVGWKVIGREREHMFQPPFGYYDKNYPGWQPAVKEADKK